MYQYSEQDQQFLQTRTEQFRQQTERFLQGQLSAEEFQQLRLRNGLYIQRLAPMLRVAIPYGLVSADQLRTLAKISRDFDKGYAHFTTRQNIQFNWPKLEAVPDLLASLAACDMHAIQTSGSCIRNITTDPLAGIAADEQVDPRPYAELMRQWSTLHPEFNWLPRKFKIAITGAPHDRAAIEVHDIGLSAFNEQNNVFFRVVVGGGLGRTPMIGTTIHERLPAKHLLTYLTAILRVYNRLGRRDNKYKARIKILVKAMGEARFRDAVDAAWQPIKGGPDTVSDERIQDLMRHFSQPDYAFVNDADQPAVISSDGAFHLWRNRNVLPHKIPGYNAVHISLKRPHTPPGDVSDATLEDLAALADEYSFGEARVTHEQNIILADVETTRLFELWRLLVSADLATPNRGLASDMICCPGGDYCSLANAKSIPVAAEITKIYADRQQEQRLGPLSINISGCMNACGHHHVGNIGILGVDKKGEEFYQISIGGDSGDTGNGAELGKILGPALSRQHIARAVLNLTQCYESARAEDETFNQTLERVGLAPFKTAVYESEAI